MSRYLIYNKRLYWIWDEGYLYIKNRITKLYDRARASEAIPGYAYWDEDNQQWETKHD